LSTSRYQSSTGKAESWNIPPKITPTISSPLKLALTNKKDPTLIALNSCNNISVNLSFNATDLESKTFVSAALSPLKKATTVKAEIILPKLPEDIQRKLESKSTISDQIPTMNNPDYILTPSLRELRQMTTQELKKVKKFTVEHKKFGKITFTRPVDLCGCAIDKVVQIEKGVIRIYPEEGTKPTPFTKLNTSANIQVYDCFPKKNSPAKFEQKLKKHCRSLGVKFHSWDTKTGVWRFQCDHF